MNSFFQICTYVTKFVYNYNHLIYYQYQRLFSITGCLMTININICSCLQQSLFTIVMCIILFVVCIMVTYILYGEHQHLVHVLQLCFTIPRYMTVNIYYSRVYDCEHYRLVQTNVGHTDAVRSIIHIPERNQVKFVNIQ